MSETTYIRLVYVFPDGDRSDLALGLIDRSGMITAETFAPGQEETVVRILAELNGQERVFREELMLPDGTDRPKLSYVSIDRGVPGFMEALQESTLKTYGIDLVFDASAFDGDSTGLDWPLPAPADDPIPPATYGAAPVPEDDS